MLKSARHIIWDWNGTLLDDASACVEALNRMLARRGLEPVALEDYRQGFGFPVWEYYRSIGFDMDGEDWDGMAREYHEHYAETSASAPLRRGSRSVLESLAGARVGMSILSACEERILRRTIRFHGLQAFFLHVAGLSDLYAASKLDLGRRLMERLDVPADDVLLVGDTLHDHEVACALQCRCILVAGGHQSTDRLRQAGRPVVPDLHAALIAAEGCGETA